MIIDNSKNPSFRIVAVFIVIALFQLGTIRRKDDPLAKAQADAILFNEKMEQEKDGKKEAPMPSFTLYGKQKFLAESPVANAPKEEVAAVPEDDVWEYQGAMEEDGQLGALTQDVEPGEDTQNLHENIDETSPGADTSKEEEDWWSEEVPPAQ